MPHANQTNMGDPLVNGELGSKTLDVSEWSLRFAAFPAFAVEMTYIQH